jgi:cytochrome c-type biogenesis protein CcmE
LSVAAALAIFVVYTALAGNGVAQLTPSTIAKAKGNVALVGKVVGRVHATDAYTRAGLRFRVKDIGDRSPARVVVVYHGSLPPLFRTGRDIIVNGTMRNGVFLASRGSLVTKCPSHYTPAKSSNT